jgi:hypothetical protein
MYDAKKDPEFCLNFSPHCGDSPEAHLPPPAWMEQEARMEIAQQLVHFLHTALRKGDARQAIRIMVRAEKIVSEFVEEGGYYSMEPILEQLQAHIRIAARMARRHIIRCALHDPEDQFYTDAMQSLVRDDAESREDVCAAERHLAEGVRLMQGLWRSKEERLKRQKLGLQ